MKIDLAPARGAARNAVPSVTLGSLPVNTVWSYIGESDPHRYFVRVSMDRYAEGIPSVQLATGLITWDKPSLLVFPHDEATLSVHGPAEVQEMSIPVSVVPDDLIWAIEAEVRRHLPSGLPLSTRVSRLSQIPIGVKFSHGLHFYLMCNNCPADGKVAAFRIGETLQMLGAGEWGIHYEN